MKINKEEISLCKQIAEKHKKEIIRGDWYIHDGDKKNMAVLHVGHEPLSFKNLISLWTISDCLEFLRAEGYLVRLVEYEHYGGVRTITCYCHGHKTKKAFSKQGNKDEEACLKAVLAILEEK